MKDKRIMLGMLALLVLLILLKWKFWAADNQTPPAAGASANNAVIDDRSSERSGSKMVTTRPASVESPKTPPVKAGGGPASLQVPCDFGELTFTDNLPLVRTLTTGETCIMLANKTDDGHIHFEANFVKSTGNLLPSNAEIEAMGGEEMQAMLNKIDQDTSVQLMASPSITITPGTEAEITVESGDISQTLSVKSIVDSTTTDKKMKLAIKMDFQRVP